MPMQQRMCGGKREKQTAFFVLIGNFRCTLMAPLLENCGSVLFHALLVRLYCIACAAHTQPLLYSSDTSKYICSAIFR